MQKVSIIGAGNVGATVAQEIVRAGLADVVLLDINEGAARGKALDLLQAAALWGSPSRVSGTADYTDTRGSDVVVITAGSPRKPGMSRDDLLKINASIVSEAASKSHAASPRARFVVVTNPLDVMAYLVWKTTGVSWRRVIGMAGVLDSARFQAFIADNLGVAVTDVRAMVLGGHGDQMVPVPSCSTVNGVPVGELMSQETLKQLCERTRNGGAEIVELLKFGSAWYAPGTAAASMVAAILQDTRRLLPCSVNAGGKYGLKSVFAGLPVVLGKRGVEQIVEVDLSEGERAALAASAGSIRTSIERLSELGLLQA
ncbi:MAG: malate dehydrogenase [Candidatus Obscuribacterales bacterium]